MSQGMWLKTNERIYLEDSTCPESLKIEGLARYRFATKYVDRKIVLDVACGSGYGSNILKNIAKEVYGVDYSREAVKYAKEFYKGISFLVASAEHLPFKDKVFDVVTSFETIEHLWKPRKFVEEMKRILKDNRGLAIISTPWLTEDYKFHGFGNHVHSFNFKFLDEILSCFPIRKYLSQVQSTNFTNLHFPSYIIALCKTRVHTPVSFLSEEWHTIPADAKEKADEILEEWDDICKQLKIVHFLFFGTCLGMVRDKGYIEWHTDIDVGVKCSADSFSELRRKLFETGFTCEPMTQYKNQHFFKHGILLDIWTDSVGHDQFLKSFDKVTYNGRVYNVPHPVEQYLEKCYGDWRVPRKK